METDTRSSACNFCPVCQARGTTGTTSTDNKSLYMALGSGVKKLSFSSSLAMTAESQKRRLRAEQAKGFREETVGKGSTH